MNQCARTASSVSLKPPLAGEQKRAILTLDRVEQDGTFSGYASVFGKTDLGNDRVEKGAFSTSLKERGCGNIRMLFQHDPAEPIGTWDELVEDDRGLFVKGRIIQSTAKGAEVLSLMREGAIDGLSIGFRTIKSRTDRTTGVRSIVKADLWEISVVTFPMLPQARISQVKNTSAPPAKLPSVREFERWLTQDAGLSRRDARTVIGKGFAHLTGKQDAAPTSKMIEQTLVQHMRRATLTIKANTKKQDVE